ncbi:MAG: hypothetical protein IPQ05_01170 [Leptospiraceae bacterium]|nr:hypothetical protein [Leptospiraceae bacterium]
MDKINVTGIVADKANHKILAIWACDCAERVLNLFEKEHPDDSNLVNAILTARLWINDKIKMVEARKKAFACHNSARNSTFESAIFAARAVGHACATAHVATHAIYAAKYALKAIKFSEADSEQLILKEKTWQDSHLILLLKGKQNEYKI